jgi:hypothetical protein
MGRRVVAVGALACALLPVFTGTGAAAARGDVPWVTVARGANVACLDYDKKIFKLPGLAALSKVRSLKDFTPKLLTQSAAPFYAGEAALKQAMVSKWSALGTPKEPAYRVAWARWLTLWKTVQIPFALKAAAGAKAGDAKAFAASVAQAEAHGTEGKKLAKTLGFAVCEWEE